ncbi:MAG TPA: glycosyltransferase, partial [Flavobacterium sp.]
MKASVIMSTYNSEEWLEKVIWGFSVQTEIDFEIIVADDGSRIETKQMLDSMREIIHIPLVHVWQEDLGFRKSEILNKAVTASSSDYLIFTDGDCIPRKDFVEAHLTNRRKGHFLSGGYFMLPMAISKLITKEDIIQQNCFDLKWLSDKGLKSTFKNIKFYARGFMAKFLNAVTPTRRTWNGHNSSGWKKDITSINGFNREMQYGGQDREFGERLNNFGVKAKQIRYSAICVHLEHERKYANEEGKRSNNRIRRMNRKNRITVIENGIKEVSGDYVERPLNNHQKLRISVIISTYNAEEWLEKVLIGYSMQSFKDYEIIIADDGSRASTKELIDSFKKDFPVPLRHLWHEDLGYRRQEILNVAIIEAAYEYILMTDGDCIPRKDFLEVHAKYAEKGKFLSGGYCKLSMKASKT